MIKYFLLVPLLFSLSLSADMFGNPAPTRTTQNSSQISNLNQQLIATNRENSAVMREYTSCMQQARTNKDRNTCYQQKKQKRSYILQKKRNIYGQIRGIRLNNQRKAMADYSKHARFENPAQEQVPVQQPTQ